MKDKTGGTRRRMKINAGKMTGGGERLRTKDREKGEDT